MTTAQESAALIARGRKFAEAQQQLAAGATEDFTHWHHVAVAETITLLTARLTTALADLARVTVVADAGLAGTKEAWAALAMIRETVEAQVVGAMTAGEHLPDPTFTTEAAAIIVGIQKIAEAAESALAVAKAAGAFREGVEAAAKVTDDAAHQEMNCAEQAEDNGNEAMRDQFVARADGYKFVAQRIRALHPPTASKRDA